jgi:hypothetical protein
MPKARSAEEAYKRLRWDGRLDMSALQVTYDLPAGGMCLLSILQLTSRRRGDYELR